MSDLKTVSLFAGIGGIDRGLELAGAKTALMCELDPHARKILARHYPHAAIHNDVTELTADDCRAAGVVPGRTVLTAGFPCQDLSVAGKRAGLEGSRSALFFHVARLLLEFRPAWVVLENVPGLLSADGPDDEHRCVCGWPYRWRGLHLSAGLGSQERGSEVVLGGGGSGDDGQGAAGAGGDATGIRGEDLCHPAGDGEVGGGLLLEGPGSGGGLDASSPGAASEAEVGAGSAGTARGGDPAVAHPGGRADGSMDSGGGGALRHYPAEDPGAQCEGSGSLPDGGDGGRVWSTDCEACGRPVGDRPNRPVVGSGFAVILRTLAELGYGIAYRILDARHFGVPQRRRRVVIVGRLGDTGAAAAQVLLEPEGVPGNPAEGIAPWPVSAAHASTGARVVGILGDHAHTLTGEGHDASEDGTGRGTPIIGFAWQAGGNNDASGAFNEGFTPTLPKSQTLAVAYVADRTTSLKSAPGGADDNLAQGGHLIAQEDHVRRLSPVECERLQGFPDGWTQGQADSQRYKQLGNSVAVPVFEWVGRRLVAVDSAQEAV